jgi:hypothetical protein
MRWGWWTYYENKKASAQTIRLHQCVLHRSGERRRAFCLFGASWKKMNNNGFLLAWAFLFLFEKGCPSLHG